MRILSIHLGYKGLEGEFEVYTVQSKLYMVMETSVMNKGNQNMN